MLDKIKFMFQDSYSSVCLSKKELVNKIHHLFFYTQENYIEVKVTRKLHYRDVRILRISNFVEYVLPTYIELRSLDK